LNARRHAVLRGAPSALLLGSVRACRSKRDSSARHGRLGVALAQRLLLALVERRRQRGGVRCSGLVRARLAALALRRALAARDGSSPRLRVSRS
jgi:hypothetical protein